MSGESAAFSPRGVGLVERRARVKPENVAWLRYVLEAHEGLAFMHVSPNTPGSQEVFLLAPVELTRALDELVRDLLDEGCLDGLCDDG